MLNIRLHDFIVGESSLRLILSMFSFVKFTCFVNTNGDLSTLSWPSRVRIEWRDIDATHKVGADILSALKNYVDENGKFLGMKGMYKIGTIPEIYFRNAVRVEEEPDEEDRSVKIGSIELVLELKDFKFIVPINIKKSVKNMKEGDWMDSVPLFSKRFGLFATTPIFPTKDKDGEVKDWVESLRFQAYNNGVLLNGELKMMALVHWMNQMNHFEDHITIFKGFCRDCKYRVHEYMYPEGDKRKFNPSRKCVFHNEWLDESEANIGNISLLRSAVGSLSGKRANERYDQVNVVDREFEVVTDGRNSIINKSITRTRNIYREMGNSVYRSCPNFAHKWEGNLDRNLAIEGGGMLNDFMYPVVNYDDKMDEFTKNKLRLQGIQYKVHPSIRNKDLAFVLEVPTDENKGVLRAVSYRK